MTGVLVNTAAVFLGGLVGLFANKGIPKRIADAIMLGVGLCVLYVGISGTLQGQNAIIPVIAIVLGAALGTALDIDGRINRLGVKIEELFNARALKKRAAQSGGQALPEEGRVSIAQGFVTASLLFCIGSMAVTGSLSAGLTGDNSILFTKSALDLVSSVMLAVSLGSGVLLSAGSIFVLQGFIVALSQLLQPVMENPALLAEMNCAGSLLIVALGLNLLGVTKIKVADYLPAIVFAPVICWITTLF